MADQSDLDTIRALSQYRPFEGGGESVLEAHEDLLLAALAEADGGLSSLGDCRAAIQTLFGIDFEELTVAAAVKRLAQSGRVGFRAGGVTLSHVERVRLENVAAESNTMAADALEDWRSLLSAKFPLTSEELRALETDLAAFLQAVILRHGAEASLLLYPDSEQAQDLYRSFEQQGFGFLPATSEKLQPIRDFGLSEFIRHPTAAQRVYLANNLNTGYFLTVLSIDPAGARFVSEIAKGQRVYLDTNFIYRLLGVQGPRYVKPAEAILHSTQGAGYSCAVTPWTLHEFKESLKRSQDFLRRYPIPPEKYAELAAEATSEENFVTAYWRRVRSGVKVKDFFAYYEEVETHLRDRGIDLVDQACSAVDQLKAEIQDEMSFLDRVAHGRPRHPATLEHDVKHRLLVKRLRKQGPRTFSNAGYWFLTHDTVLPRYDFLSTVENDELPFCVSAGAWFQTVEAFRSKTDDFGQSLADMLASPYVRYRRVLSQEAALAVVARVEQYKDGSPELAARVFMNTAAMNEIEAAEDISRTERIDNAIVRAAEEAQADARRAQAVAEHERRRAEAIEREADTRIRELEAQHEDERERARAREDAAVSEAKEKERERRERVLAEERRLHGSQLTRRDKALMEARERELRARLRFARTIVFGIAIAAFLLLDLAVGIQAAWAVLIAAATLLGLGLSVDVVIRRGARPPSEG